MSRLPTPAVNCFMGGVSSGCIGGDSLGSSMETTAPIRISISIPPHDKRKQWSPSARRHETTQPFSAWRIARSRPLHGGKPDVGFLGLHYIPFVGPLLGLTPPSSPRMAMTIAGRSGFCWLSWVPSPVFRSASCAGAAFLSVILHRPRWMR